MNLCNECIKEGTHKTHHVDIFSVIKPSKEESDQIKTGIKNAENNSNSEDNIQEIDNKEEKRGEIYEEINEDIII